MKNFLILIVFNFMALLIATTGIVAAQTSKPPNRIFGVYSERVPICFNSSADSKTQVACEGKAANWILVAPNSNDRAWIEVDLKFYNGHSCKIEGLGEWEKDHILLQKHGDETCELKVYFKNNKAILSDDGRCRSNASCGARGYYDGIALPKSGSM